MQVSQENVFMRDDTFFGVCQAIGEDFGFNPNWLRLALGVSLLLSPTAVVATYFGAGVLVLASRLIVPVRSRKARLANLAATEASVAPKNVHADCDNQAAALAAAA